MRYTKLGKGYYKSRQLFEKKLCFLRYTNLGKGYYKSRQLFFITNLGKGYYKSRQLFLLQIQAKVITNLGRYYKSRQRLLQFQAGITNLGNYTKHGTTDEKHLSNFIYKFDCRNKKCNDNYVGETARHKKVRESEHAGKDKESHVFKHTQATKHLRANEKNFVILAKNYENRRKRKLAEALFIRDRKPTLNKQKDSYKLVLFG